MLRGVIYDLDGVLAKPDSSPKRDCEISALQQHKIEVSEEEFKRLKGLSPSDKIHEIVASSNHEAAGNVIDTKLELNRESIGEVKEVEGIKEVVSRLTGFILVLSFIS